MPLYDFRCQHCEGIFEHRVAIAHINSNTINCQYCSKPTLAKPMMTGRNKIHIKTRWRAQSSAEQLAGPLVAGPGTQSNSPKSSVLHNCKGINCSVCRL